MVWASVVWVPLGLLSCEHTPVCRVFMITRWRDFHVPIAKQPAPTLLCAFACDLGQFDWVGGLVRTQAMSRHPRAAIVPWLRAPAVAARSRVRAWRWLGGRPRCRRCFDLSCGEHERPLCSTVARSVCGCGTHSAIGTFASTSLRPSRSRSEKNSAPY